MKAFTFAVSLGLLVCGASVGGISLTVTSAEAQAQPATRVISGTIRSEADRSVLSGATVELSSTRFNRRLRTDDDGRFRFGTIPVGTYRLNVLRLGFAPLSRMVTVADSDADLDVTLAPDARTLNAIVTRANVTAVFGGIGAAGLSPNANGERPLSAAPNVRVQVLGSSLETETDSLGRFFLELKKEGRYLVRVSAPGLVPQIYSVDVPRNKAVDISRLLDSARTDVAERPEYIMRDMDRRIGWRGINSAVVSGEELREYGGTLSFALQRTRGMTFRSLRLVGGECVVVDGVVRPNMPLDAIRPEEVEAIEVYGSGNSEPTGTLRDMCSRARGTANTRPNRTDNAVVYVVIWTVR